MHDSRAGPHLRDATAPTPGEGENMKRFKHMRKMHKRGKRGFGKRGGGADAP